ncbi:hypothetical protein [Mycobacterium intracellulare]|uniref:hypothetical protein n=1 Tax=Mycobacterium intracellulare TaxID=1767 RepID=UPI00109EB39D|nr:hypothetical protein [Mycobacterium intracellulare]
MARWRLRRKPKGISKDQIDKVMKSQRVHDAVQAKAVTVQTYWKEISPVFDPSDPREHRKKPPHGQPGAYRDSVIVTDTSDAEGASARVKPTDFKAKWIEFGTAHMPEYAPMAKVKAKFRK